MNGNATRRVEWSCGALNCQHHFDFVFVANFQYYVNFDCLKKT